MIRRGGVGVVLFAGMVAITAGLWRITPGSLVPDEDQGYYISAVILPDGATLQRTDKVVGEVDRASSSRTPPTQDVVAFTGFDFLGGGFRNNAATIFVTQKPWDERKVTAAQLVGELFMKTGAHQGGAGARLQPAADLRPGHRGRLRVLPAEPRRGRRQAHGRGARQFLGAANSDPKLGGVQTLWRATVPQLYVDVDREKAKALGVPINDVFDTLAATLGNFYVNDFNRFGRTWQVLMSAEPAYRKRPDDIGSIYVRSENGRDGAALVARERSSTRPAPTRSTASTTCRR